MKSCGSCRYFSKWKNDKIGGGLCDRYDMRTESDSIYGRNCPGWRGIKYRRKSENVYRLYGLEKYKWQR